MKRIFALLLCASALLFPGCQKEENIVFDGTLLEVYEGNGESFSVLVETADNVGFDKATVSIDPSQVPLPFNFIVGVTYRFTVLPEILTSYPVQATAVAVHPVAGPTESAE